MDDYNTIKQSFYFKLFGNRAGGFETALWEAFQKADSSNQCRLAIGFPVHFQVYMDWYNSPSEREYFVEFLNGEQGR